MIQYEDLRLLFLEDNIFQARLTMTIIETYLHSRVTHVTTLARAMEELEKEPFDLALLDLVVPDAEGLTALTTVQHRYPTLPIIVLTGQEEEMLARTAVEVGAQDFIHKSNLDPELLKRSIRYAILRHQTQLELKKIREQQMVELKNILKQMEEMNWDGLPTRDGNDSVVAVALRMRDPQAFDRLLTRYHLLLQDFTRRVEAGKSIYGFGKSLGTQLMELNANPNDVNDLHLTALQRYLHDKSTEEKKSIMIDSRMFALEVMGHLAEAYRKEFLEKKLI